MFRFTIRDVLWLTVVIGLAVGWWINRTHAAKQEQEWINRFNPLTDAVRMEGWEIVWSHTQLTLENRNGDTIMVSR